ncbi:MULTISPECIES: hypothetical protein [Enterococcus]|uniref:hypothetical protein n=1 Tax=Enterococcus TaxID=1350 RepID=UPI000F5009B7|nr:hypothetical protein [Enterococcus hirae]MCH1651689.1 hypothetical protein [Enterococcus hirae]MDV7770597.1 hypothetical protein [Enterococcus hirae]ROX93980.1 hypothetical protein EGW49_04990 [Enterococcus hirae]ROY02383.1 hypothetical protein EGW54_06475 [Enterococcus hirae]ROY51632.1 hypothetical protein EGW66_04035 [Enterococcus hirae]
MKNVLLTISLIANIVLAGVLFYTVTEMNKIDDKRESLAIDNEQYKKNLAELNSTTENNQEVLESSRNVYGNESQSKSENSIVSEESTEIEPQNATITIGTRVFNFVANGLTIEQDLSKQGKMTELSHEYPVIVTTPSATLDGVLVQDNNDNNCYIMIDGQTIYSGTYQ